MQTLIYRNSKTLAAAGLSFFLALSLTGWALRCLEVNQPYKAFLGVWPYLITCSFTLAKILRDRHEADLDQARKAGRMPGQATRSTVEAE